MIRDVVNLSLLEVGQKLSVGIVSHSQLEMVQENHSHVIKLRVIWDEKLDIPLPCTPYKSVLKNVQLNGVFFQWFQW